MKRHANLSGGMLHEDRRTGRYDKLIVAQLLCLRAQKALQFHFVHQQHTWDWSRVFELRNSLPSSSAKAYFQPDQKVDELIPCWRGNLEPPFLQGEGSVFLLKAIINLRNYTVSKLRSIEPHDLQVRSYSNVFYKQHLWAQACTHRCSFTVAQINSQIQYSKTNRNTCTTLHSHKSSFVQSFQVPIKTKSLVAYPFLWFWEELTLQFRWLQSNGNAKIKEAAIYLPDCKVSQ